MRAILVLLFGMMIHSFVTNPRWEWSWVGTIMTYSPVLQGLVQGTIVGTVAVNPPTRPEADLTHRPVPPADQRMLPRLDYRGRRAECGQDP